MVPVLIRRRVVSLSRTLLLIQRLEITLFVRYIVTSASLLSLLLSKIYVVVEEEEELEEEEEVL